MMQININNTKIWQHRNMVTPGQKEAETMGRKALITLIYIFFKNLN